MVEKAKIQSVSNIRVQGFIMTWNGYKFEVIYGHFNTDWFVAIPNWEVCVKITNPGEPLYYNVEKIGEQLGSIEKGRALAESIKEHWEGLKK